MKEFKGTPGKWKYTVRNVNEMMTTFHGVTIGDTYIEAAARREAEAKAAAERAERERIEAEQRAQREAKEAAERAEREKQAAIEAERRKAQEEAERIRREAEAKEQARIAEEKRIKEEEECRAKDKAHRKEVNNKILADLIKVGASEDVAKNIITAIVKGEVFATKITY